MGTILDEIIETKRAEVARAMAERPLDSLKSSLRDLPPPRDFFDAIATSSPRGINLIAEIKRKSPSAGLIRPDFCPEKLARIYEAHGANALSVLTDGPYFDGRLEFIEQVKAVTDLPVLRKDFMIDSYQLYESRAAGADAILLIGECLPPKQVNDLLDLAFDLGLTTLIEVHAPQTFDRLQEVISFPDDRRSLLGINNRDLHRQMTDLATTETLAQGVPQGTVLVSESGVKTPCDVERLRAAGAHALLIGETFMRAPDIGAKVTELLGPIPSV